MKVKNRMLLSVVWIILGMILFACGVFGAVDSFWCGMGGGLLGVGIGQIIRYVRYMNNEEYRENVDIRNTDERNLFLAGKAWSWAGCLFVMINGAAVIVLKIFGYEQLSVWAAYNISLLIVLYWGSFQVLRKKH